MPLAARDNWIGLVSLDGTNPICPRPRPKAAFYKPCCMRNTSQGHCDSLGNTPGAPLTTEHLLLAAGPLYICAGWLNRILNRQGSHTVAGRSGYPAEDTENIDKVLNLVSGIPLQGYRNAWASYDGTSTHPLLFHIAAEVRCDVFPIAATGLLTPIAKCSGRPGPNLHTWSTIPVGSYPATPTIDAMERLDVLRLSYAGDRFALPEGRLRYIKAISPHCPHPPLS
jgi:hypothetical protein